MKHHHERPIAAAMIALLLTACGGSGTGSLPNANASAGIAAPIADAAASRHKIKGTLRITIPKGKRHKRILIHGHYVSPATESIAIAVTPAGGGTVQNFNENLTTASNPNCTQGPASPLSCTISLSLAPGSYTATFATYDGLLNGSGVPTGNELSANQSVSFTFAVGTANTISATLDGIPTSVAIVPLDAKLTGNTSSGFVASTSLSSSQVEVIGLDADKNFIIGPGAPTPELVSNNTTNLAVATPSPSSPNVFTLTQPTVSSPNTNVQLTASVTPQTGSGVTSTPTAVANVNFQTLVNGNFATGSLGPWYACGYARAGLSAPVNASPAPISPTPQPTSLPTFAPVASPTLSTLAVVATPPANFNPTITATAPPLGNYVAFTGSQNSENKGTAGICQQIAVNAAQPYLSFYVYEAGVEYNFKYADQEATILDSTGTTVQSTLFAELNCFDDYPTLGAVTYPTSGCEPNATTYPGLGFNGTQSYVDFQGGYWVQRGPYNLSAYAGTTVTLFIGVFLESNDAAPSKYWNGMFVGNVQMSSSSTFPGNFNGDAKHVAPHRSGT